MKLAKSLLLASAAGFAAFGAQAADLPSKKAAPVEYVKVCPQYGAGFFQIPGSDTCLRVGGRVHADVRGTETFTSNAEKETIGAEARIAFDARSNTEYGLLRGYAILSANAGTMASSTTDENVFLVQLGGLFAGYNPNNFGRLSNPFDYNGLVGRTTKKSGQIGYTAAMGATTATLALENSYSLTGSAGMGTATLDSRIPDVIAKLSHTVGPVTATVTGLLHEVNVDNYSSKFGYGVQGMIEAKDLFTKGTRFGVGYAFVEGAPAYLGVADVAAATATAQPTSNANIAIEAADAGIVNGQVKLNRAQSVTGVIAVPVTATLTAAVTGGWLSYDQSSARTNDFTRYGVTGGLIWTPVKGLIVMPEYNYSVYDQKDVAGTGRVQSGNIRLIREF